MTKDLVEKVSAAIFESDHGRPPDGEIETALAKDAARVIIPIVQEACAKECDEWADTVKSVGSWRTRKRDEFIYRSAALAIREIDLITGTSADSR